MDWGTNSPPKVPQPRKKVAWSVHAIQPQDWDVWCPVILKWPGWEHGWGSTSVPKHKRWPLLVAKLRTTVVSAPVLHIVVHVVFPTGEWSIIGMASLIAVESSARLVRFPGMQRGLVYSWGGWVSPGYYCINDLIESPEEMLSLKTYHTEVFGGWLSVIPHVFIFNFTKKSAMADCTVLLSF